MPCASVASSDPPAKAKSQRLRAAVVRQPRVAQRVAGIIAEKPFVTLLTKFSTPEDVFGPLSLKRLEEGVYERLVNDYLPAARVAFVDEIYKANASILNAMLSILNERRFYNGSTVLEVPLLSLLAASNELPDDDDLLFQEEGENRSGDIIYKGFKCTIIRLLLIKLPLICLTHCANASTPSWL